MKAAQQTVEEIAFAHVVDAFGRGFLCAPNKVAVETFKSENLHDFSLLLRRQGTFPILDSGKETLGDLQLLGQFTLAHIPLFSDASYINPWHRS